MKRFGSKYAKVVVDGKQEAFPSNQRRVIAPSKDGGYEFTDELLYPCEAVVPDKGLKVRDIIDRFTRGLPTGAEVKRGVFAPDDKQGHDSPDWEEIGRLDRMEKADIARSAKVNRKAPKVEPKEVPKVVPEPVKKSDQSDPAE